MSKLLAIIQRTIFQYRSLVSASLLRALIYECRNFGCRIGSIWQSPIYRRGLEIGPEYHSVQWAGFQPCTRIQKCISDIEQLCIDRPWLTLADEEIFLLGWRKGEKSPHCRICTETGDICSSASRSCVMTKDQSERLNGDPVAP
jgi:hypothetical protein